MPPLNSRNESPPSPSWFPRTILAPARRAWSVGGGWERFFILFPVGWGSYFSIGFAWVILSRQPYEVGYSLSIVGLSAIALMDAWVAPILSATVLRALVGRG